MHLFYIDESGNTGADLTSRTEPIHWLVALATTEHGLQAIETDMLAIATKHFKARARESDFELHGVDIFGGRGEARPLTPAQRVILFGELLSLIERQHDALSAEIHEMDGEVKRLHRDHPMIERLHTIPGVGLFGTLLLVAEIGAIERFQSAHQLAAYAGLVPSTRSSGGKTSHGGVGHASNRWLKWILVEIVQTLKQAPGPVGDQYRKLLRAKGKPKATTAAARKLCCYIYWMWRRGLSYDEWLLQRCDNRRSEVRPVQRMGAVA
jgi:transposase